MLSPEDQRTFLIRFANLLLITNYLLRKRCIHRKIKLYFMQEIVNKHVKSTKTPHISDYRNSLALLFVGGCTKDFVNVTSPSHLRGNQFD